MKVHPYGSFVVTERLQRICVMLKPQNPACPRGFTNNQTDFATLIRSPNLTSTV